MHKIVILDSQTIGSKEELSCFDKYGEVTSYKLTSREETFERIQGVDIIITNKVTLDKEVIDRCDKLKLICITATGTNNVDIEYANSKNIQVIARPS